MKVPIIMRATSDLRFQQNGAAVVFVIIADDGVDPSSGRLLPILRGFDIPRRAMEEWQCRRRLHRCSKKPPF